MIGKAKAISHGINDLRYIMGESQSKTHPEKINFYCCPIKIGIVYYSFETAFEQANLFLVSKSNPSYVGKSSNCRIF